MPTIQPAELFEAIERLAPAIASVPPKPPETPPAAAVFDKEAALRQMNGDMALLQELSDLFFREACPKLLEAIRQAVDNQDAIQLRQAAHTLKGEVGNFGAISAFEATLRLETMGRDEDFTNADDSRLALEATLTQLQAALLALAHEAAS